MKLRLLSMLAMVAMSITAMAQTTWTPPAFDASKGIELKSSATDTVYLYNVGAAQFLIGGTAWGTHSALGEGLPIRLTSTTPETGATYWQVYFFEGSKNKQLLFNDNGTDCYIDLNNQSVDKSYWAFTKVGDYYRIQSFSTAVSDPEAFDETLFFGQVPTREDFDQNGNSLGYGVGVFADVTKEEEDAHIDWIIVSKKDFVEYHAVITLKNQLLSIINTIEDLGVDVDEQFIDILNNDNATEAEVQQALKEIKPAFIEAASEFANNENPVNVTSLFLVNPDFNGKSTTGWTLTGSYAKTQNNKPHPIETGKGVGEEGLDTGGWLEFWKSGGIDAYQDAHQVITDLPAGSYRLELVGSGKGGKLYAITNGIRQENTIPSAEVQRLSFEFVHIGGDLTFGFDFTPAEGTNPAWVAVDKFRLYYLGVGESPTIIIMRNAVSALDPYLDQEEHHIVSTTLYNEIEALSSQANALISANNPDEDENTAVINAINEMADRAAAEAAAYDKLDGLANTTLPATIEQYTKYDQSPAMSAMVEQLEDMKDDASTAFVECSWDITKIEEVLAAYEEVIEQGILAYKSEIRQALADAVAKVNAGEELDEPLDITILFDPLTFPEEKTLAKNLDDSYGWNFTEIEKFNDNDGLKFEHHTAEGWSCVFDANTVIEGLPKGKYSIQVKAFYRPTTDEDALSIYEGDGRPELAFFYVNNGASNKQAAILNWDELLEDFPKTTVEDEEVDNRPNSQTAAHALFVADSDASAKTAIALTASIRDDEGSLTIGAKGIEGLATNCWIVWSDITLLYEGAIDASARDEEIEALIATANELADNPDVTIVLDNEDKLAQASANGTEALGENEETQDAAIQQLTEAIEYANHSIELYSEFSDVYNEYSLKLETIQETGNTYTDTSYEDLIAEAGILSESGFDTNEALQGIIDGLKDGWYPYIFSKEGFSEATEDVPVDMSELIRNPSFETSYTDGWTIVADNQGSGQGRETIMEFWNSSTFEFYQELPQLTEGYWRLSVDGLFRAGNSNDELAVLSEGGEMLNEEYLYALINGEECSAKIVQWSDFEKGAIKVITEGEEGYDEYAGLVAQLTGQTSYDVTPTEGEPYSFLAPNNQASLATFIKAGRYHTSFNFGYKEGDGAVRIGLKLMQTIDYNWCPFDNFCLEYLGKTQPTGVEALAAEAGTAKAAIVNVYSIDGRQQAQLRRGINIVRTADGAVRKVLVK